MTDAVIHDAGASRATWLATLGRTLRRVIITRATFRALDELPDEALRDVGLTRGEIPFVADAVASGCGDPTREALHHINKVEAARDACLLPYTLPCRATRRAACSSARCPTG